MDAMSEMIGIEDGGDVQLLEDHVPFTRIKVGIVHTYDYNTLFRI